MADEELISIGAQDNFSAVLDKAAEAAENFAKRVNAAFGTIKPGEAKEKIGELGEKLEGLGEKAGGAVKLLGSQFGEGGKLIGEAAEGAIQVISGLGSAMLTMRGHGKEAASELEHLASSANKITATGGALSVLSSIGARTRAALSSAEAGAAEGGEGAAGGGFLGALASRLGLLGGGAAAAGGAAIGLYGFSAERSEEIQKMAQGVGTTVDEFIKLYEISSKFGLSVSNTASLFQGVHEGIHEAAIASREVVDQWEVMRERVSLINDRIKQGSIERKEAEHGAADQARDDQHSIEQAVNHLADVREKNRRADSDDAKRLAAHGGVPRTLNEQVEQRRQEAYERDKRNREEIEAVRAVQEAQHKAADDARKADEERSARTLQATREQTLLDRFQARERIEQLNIEERSQPKLKAFLAEGRAAGVTDFSANLKRARDEVNRIDTLPVQEQFRALAKTILSLPDGAEKTRLLNQNFGDLASKVREFGTELSRALSPKEFEAFKSALSAQDVEAMAKKFNHLVESLTTVSDWAIRAGRSVGWAVDEIKKAWDAGADGTVKGLNTLRDRRGIVVGGAPATIQSKESETTASERAAQSLTGAASAADHFKQSAEGAAKEADKEKQRHAKQQEQRSTIERSISTQTGIKPSGIPGVDIVSTGQSVDHPINELLRRSLQDHPPVDIQQFFKPPWLPHPIEDQSPPSARPPQFSPFFKPLGQLEDGQSSKLAMNAERVSTALADADANLDRFSSKLQEVTRKTDDTGSGRASGGMISGSGGPTSDSIPIMVSHGEYIVNAKQTARHYSLIKAINDDRLGGFAFGGLVLDLPRFASGGDVAGSHGEALHPVTIKLPGGESIDGFHGSPSAIEAMSRYAITRQAASTMKSKPTWVRS